jgi:hypothetical protein
MNPEAAPPASSPGSIGSAPGTPEPGQTQPKRIALSWVCFLSFLAVVLVFELLGGPWRIANAVIFTAGGVALGLQALKPSVLPIRRIFPAWYGLNNRVVPASRAYGSRFDRIARAVAALICFYAVVTTPGINGLIRLGN